MSGETSGRAPGLRAAVALLLLLGACTTTRGARETKHLSDHLTLTFHAQDRDDAERVREAAERALPAVQRWGALRDPVSIDLAPDHTALEEAADRDGHPWLRAWARYDTITVQSPSTWMPLIAPTQRDVDELLLHELTHCAMYQSAASRTEWRRKGIPLWFREGMASVTAEQGYRWATLEELAALYDRGLDPLQQREDDPHPVYGAAHHAFAFLIKRYGEDAVRTTLQAMKAGAIFPDALTSAIGVSPAQLLRDFERYVRLRGFKGGRVLRKPDPPPPPSLTPR
jgi:hypothetical protein